MYLKGEGVVQDDTVAFRLFNLAAKLGDANAQFTVGWMYGTGAGVTEDLLQAYIWWDIAATGGNEGAKRNLDLLQQSPSPDENKEAHKLAEECVRSKYEDC